jgi:hypothetical protein
VATKDGVQASENTNIGRPFVYYDLDNLGEITATSTFDGDNVVVSNSGGAPQKASASPLRAYSTTALYEQQRPYQSPRAPPLARKFLATQETLAVNWHLGKAADHRIPKARGPRFSSTGIYPACPHV